MIYCCVCAAGSHGTRPVLFVTARVHPGETPASFVVHGFVDWLLSHQAAAQKLRQEATVVVVPMLNPDGVFLGNYRSAGTVQDCAEERHVGVDASKAELGRAANEWLIVCLELCLTAFLPQQLHQLPSTGTACIASRHISGSIRNIGIAFSI